MMSTLPGAPTDDRMATAPHQHGHTQANMSLLEVRRNFHIPFPLVTRVDLDAGGLMFIGSRGKAMRHRSRMKGGVEASMHSPRNPAADAPRMILEHLDTALSCAQKEGPSVAGSRGDVGTMRSPVQNSIGGRPRSLAWRASCHSTWHECTKG